MSAFRFSTKKFYAFYAVKCVLFSPQNGVDGKDGAIIYLFIYSVHQPVHQLV